MLLGLTTFVTTRSRTPQNDCNTSSPAEGPGPGCGTRGRRQGLAKQQANALSNISDLAPLVWRAPEGSAAVLVGGGGAWPDNEATHRTTRQYTKRRRCEGRRRDLPRCRWAAAGPGRASRRRAEPHVSTPSAAGVKGAGGICHGAGGRRQGLAGLRGDAPSHTSVHQAPPV